MKEVQLDDLDLFAVDREVLLRARRIPNPNVRTLDAIHLASALEMNVRRLTFVTYDKRLASAARDAGFTVAAPG